MARLIASFQQELTDHPAGEGAEPFFASVSADAQRGYLSSARYRYLIAEHSNRMLGFIALRDLSHIFHLFVERSNQGTGLARRLWDEARARVLDIATPDGFTVNSSIRAVPVYEAFGFAPSGPPMTMHGVTFVPMRLVMSRTLG